MYKIKNKSNLNINNSVFVATFLLSYTRTNVVQREQQELKLLATMKISVKLILLRFYLSWLDNSNFKKTGKIYIC